jgi:hypothetical protein
MAVTIDEMQVEVQQQSAAPVSASAEAPAPKEAMSFRREKEMLAERELRLKAD